MSIELNEQIINIGEKLRSQIQYDIPYTVDRFEFFNLFFQKKEIEIHTLCHNLYKKIHNG